MFVRCHPGVESALTLDDVSPGQEFITYIPNQEVVERGVFTSGPGYSEVDRWTPGPPHSRPASQPPHELQPHSAEEYSKDGGVAK